VAWLRVSVQQPITASQGNIYTVHAPSKTKGVPQKVHVVTVHRATQNWGIASLCPSSSAESWIASHLWDFEQLIILSSSVPFINVAASVGQLTTTHNFSKTKNKKQKTMTHKHNALQPKFSFFPSIVFV
jgi:hypothetical protein